MKIEVELNENTFRVLVDGNQSDSLPAYLLRYGSLAVFGGEAFAALKIYPQYVFSPSRACMEDDAQSFLKIVDFMDGYIYSKYSSHVHELRLAANMPDSFLRQVKQYTNIAACKRSSLAPRVNNLSSASGIRLYRLATKALLSNQMDCGLYHSYHTQLFSLLKADFFGTNITRTVRLAQKNGTVTEYTVEPYDRAGDEQTELRGIRDESLKTMFISPFSYGKTTLINAFAGFDALKMEYTAETSAVTELVGAPLRRVTIEYRNGRSETLSYGSVEELKDILPKYNSVSSGRSDILHIRIYSPDLDLPCVTLLDTPGLMSINDRHDEITESEIKLADIVIFVIDPELIGDKAYMLKVKEYIDKKISGRVAFLINRYDIWKDRQKIIETELSKVLDHFGIRGCAKLKMSGLFCYVAKNVLNGRMNLRDVQKMKNIVFEDDEGNLVAGRSLTQEHMDMLYKLSNAEELEKFLFLEYKSMIATKSRS